MESRLSPSFPNLSIKEGDDAFMPTTGVSEQGQMNDLPVVHIPTEEAHLHPSRTLLTDENKAHVLTGADHVILSTAKGDHSASISIESFRKAASTYTETLPLIIAEKEGGSSIQPRKIELNISNGKTQAENRNILKTLKAAIVSSYSQAKADSIDELQPFALLKAKPLTAETLRKIFETLDGNKTESLFAAKSLPALQLKGGGATASIQSNISAEASLRFSEILASINSTKELAFQQMNSSFEQWCVLLNMQEETISSLENQRIVLQPALSITITGHDRMNLLREEVVLESARRRAQEALCDHPIAMQFLTRSNNVYQLSKRLITTAIRNTALDPLEALKVAKIARQAFLNTATFSHWNTSLMRIQSMALELDQTVRRVNTDVVGIESLEAATAAQSQWSMLLEMANQAATEARTAQAYWSSELLP